MIPLSQFTVNVLRYDVSDCLRNTACVMSETGEGFLLTECWALRDPSYTELRAAWARYFADNWTAAVMKHASLEQIQDLKIIKLIEKEK